MLSSVPAPARAPNHHAQVVHMFENMATTLREHFAAMAMQGFCANPESWKEQNYSERAAAARMQADALLAELAKEGK